MDIDYNNIIDEFVKRGGDNAILASLGYVHTDADICDYQAFNILAQMQEVDYKLTDEQKENVSQMYNKLII